MSTKKSDRLLQTDVHVLADSRRFSKLPDAGKLTLDSVPEGWRATFERATSAQDWDCILRTCQRMPNNIYFAAVEACAGRDSHSQKIAASRERATAFLDSI